VTCSNQRRVSGRKCDGARGLSAVRFTIVLQKICVHSGHYPRIKRPPPDISPGVVEISTGIPPPNSWESDGARSLRATWHNAAPADRMTRRLNAIMLTLNNPTWNAHMSERVEALFLVLSFMLVALSVYLLRRATFVPSFPDQPSLTLAWQSRLHARARVSAIFALFVLSLLMIIEAFEAITGG
jgi:hypothetical protein